MKRLATILAIWGISFISTVSAQRDCVPTVTMRQENCYLLCVDYLLVSDKPQDERCDYMISHIKFDNGMSQRGQNHFCIPIRPGQTISFGVMFVNPFTGDKIYKEYTYTANDVCDCAIRPDFAYYQLYDSIYFVNNTSSYGETAFYNWFVNGHYVSSERQLVVPHDMAVEYVCLFIISYWREETCCEEICKKIKWGEGVDDHWLDSPFRDPFTIYPNPTSSTITIRLSPFVEDTESSKKESVSKSNKGAATTADFQQKAKTYVIRDMMGKTLITGVMEGDMETVDVSGFANGIYLFEVKGDNDLHWVGKFLVDK